MNEHTKGSTQVEARHERLASGRLVGAGSFVGRYLQTISVAVVLIVLMVYFSFATSGFLSISNLGNVLEQASPIIIVGVAMTYVIISAGIDLSVGAAVAVSGAGVASLLSRGWSVSAAVCAVLAAGIAIGALNGYFSMYQRLQPFIVTLGTLSILTGVALLITGGYSVPITQGGWLTTIGQGEVGPIPVSVLVAAGVAIVAWIGLTKTPFGRYVTALGSNAESLRRSGVNTRLVGFSVYVICGMAGCLAGMIIAARLGSGSANAGGTTFGLTVITAVVLGGTDLFGGRGTIVGTVLGALVLGVIENGLILSQVDTFYVPIVQGAILLIAILVNTRSFARFNSS